LIFFLTPHMAVVTTSELVDAMLRCVDSVLRDFQNGVSEVSISRCGDPAIPEAVVNAEATLKFTPQYRGAVGGLFFSTEELAEEQELAAIADSRHSASPVWLWEALTAALDAEIQRPGSVRGSRRGDLGAPLKHEAPHETLTFSGGSASFPETARRATTFAEIVRAAKLRKRDKAKAAADSFQPSSSSASRRSSVGTGGEAAEAAETSSRH